jgi:hypothetical protein
MPTIKVNFKSPTKASEFSKNFGVVGIKATVKVDGSTVTITSNDSKTHDFVKQMVADLKSEAKMEAVTTNFLKAIIESSSNESIVETTLHDGSTVSIEPKFASEFIKIHDSLSEDTGQSMLRTLAVESVDTFKKTKAFVAKEQK